MPRESLHGKIALITGAGKRIGRATALALAREGVQVIAHYNHSADEAHALVEELRGHGGQGWTLQGDFASPEGYETLIGRALETAGGLDILVNNASIFPLNKLDEMTFGDLMTNIEVNAWAPFALGREFARQVKTGKIINLLDARIRGYDWNHVAYITSKHVLAVLTRMSALQFAPAITVNSVAPGLILPPPGQDESYLDKLIGSVPLRKHGEADDIADAIVYLAQSTFITGEVIYVDGGRHLLETISGSYPR